MKRIVITLLVLFAGCLDGPPQPARVRYNAGVKALAEDKLDDAASAFVEARNEAGYDGALRFRAAFNLGETFARKAEKAAADGADHDAAAAIDNYRQAVGWFSDALRLQKDDADARANLERVQARILALVDEANKGENGLEHRLDELISGERKLRDLVRGLWQAQDARGAGADPLADKDSFDATSTQQRTLAADAGVLADMAGDEITAIGGKAEAQRKDEEKARLVQLQNLDIYVQDARKEMTDARRNLTELKAELAYRRVEGALEALKRAREQLLDPITVLRGVAQDHLELLGHVSAIEKARGERKLGDAAPEIPQWMQPVALGGRQLDIRARLEEVKARLTAAKDQEKVKAAIAAALPEIETASAAMMKATESLRADDVKGGAAAEREALEALARAIEQFLDLRGLIDISLAEQGPVVAALTPPPEGQQPAMTAAERARLVGDGAARNRERVVRMQAMIAELAKPPPPPADGKPAQPEDPEAAKQREELYGRAEALRAEAQTALDELVAVAKGGKGPPALESATKAQKKLEEMQQLFFSVIEHLKKLIRDQGETRDKTNDAVTQDDISRRPLLPPIAQREQGHSQMASSIAEALAKQADAAAAAAAQQQQPGQPQGPNPQAFKEAAGEVRNALTSMQTAVETLAKAADPNATMSFDLSPVLDSQGKAIEHLENALRLLQPPQKQDDQKQDQQKQDQQKQDQQKQDQQKQDQQQQQQQQQQQDQAQNKDDAEKRLQQVREREAQRQRDRREQQRSAPDPVDKDW